MALGIQWLKDRFARGANPRINQGRFPETPVDEAILSSAVWACVQRITARSASANFGVYRWDRDAGDYIPQPNHPLNPVLRSPSPRHSAFTFWRTVSEHVLYHGNAYVVMGGRVREQRRADGTVTVRGVPPRFMLIADPTRAQIKEIEETDARGVVSNTVYYDLVVPRVRRSVQPQRQFPSDVAHVKGPNFDQHDGASASPVSHAAAAAIAVLGQSMLTAAELARNSARFAAVLESRVEGGAEGAEKSGYIDGLREDIASLGAGSVPITPHGVNLKPWQSPPADGQISQNLNWGVAEVARVMGVPLAMIQHTQGQRPDINQLEDAIQRDAVVPLVSAMSGALTYAGLTGDERVRGYVVMAPTLRGYPSQFGLFDMAMRGGQTQVMTINELRQLLGLPPIEGGDVIPQTAGTGASPDRPEQEPSEESEDEDDEERTGQDGD